MNKVFPQLCIPGEDAIEAMEEHVTEKMGGRCAQCMRYRRLEAVCTEVMSKYRPEMIVSDQEDETVEVKSEADVEEVLLTISLEICG